MGKKYERVDYRDLLAELSGEKKNKADNLTGKNTEQDNKELFDRKISDKKIQYIVVDNTIHYKTCRVIKGTSLEILVFLTDYKKIYLQCPQCALAAYLHIGAEDPNNERNYREFFKKARFSLEYIRDMYLNQKCSTRLAGNIMYVKNRADNWKIELLANGRVRLFHNNYITHPDYTRRITDGYHVQSEGVTMVRAVANLSSYNYVTKPELHITESSEEISKLAKDTELKMPFVQRWKSRVKRLAQRIVNGNDSICIEGLKPVEEYGYPKDGKLCVYVWKNKTGECFWMMGAYSAERCSFSAVYNGRLRNVNADKVIAWKEMISYDFRLR